MDATSRCSYAALLAILGVMTLTGCATPIDVKTASRTQLDGLSTLDTGVADLRASFREFHQAKDSLIRQEGQMLIARQAIDAAVPLPAPSAPPPRVTADQAFEGYKRDVEVFIDNAFVSSDLPVAIAAAKAKRDAASDSRTRTELDLQIQDLETRLSRVPTSMPKSVSDIETSFERQIAKNSETAEAVDAALHVLQAQLALMRAMAARVDAWLAIDVTITQQQADALKQALSGAITAIQGGAK